ncbi:hypothetical protein U1Q18_002036 [Sarracenia purpurea var. burkii]
MAFVNLESYGNAFELDNFLATLPVKKRVEDLVAKAGGRVEVELVSSSTGGFVVSFGSLLEFLPYRNLIARWKFLAFQSWLRIKGLDPSKYKLNLGVVGYNGITNTTSLDSSLSPGIDQIVGIDISPDMKLEDLPRIYDQEKLKFLLPFVGQSRSGRLGLGKQIRPRSVGDGGTVQMRDGGGSMASPDWWRRASSRSKNQKKKNDLSETVDHTARTELLNTIGNSWCLAPEGIYRDTAKVVASLCIPYRYKTCIKKEGKDGDQEELEVLMISSQKGQGMLFPKGGWELDESIEEAALRETLEEAGVIGKVEVNLPLFIEFWFF